MGVFSKECRSFVKELARRIRLQNNDSTAYLFLCQRSVGVFSNDCRSFVKDVAEESDCGTMIHLPICHCVRE
jgi:site-specific recombinase XerD